MNNAVTRTLGIRYPIIQAGMVWCSGWELASAVSNAGGLGIIGSGSMYPEILREHIRKCKAATQFPFAVNLPLIYPQIEEHVAVLTEEQVPIVFTSAGNPSTWTSRFKEDGKKVVHVVSSARFAVKAQKAGVDMVVAEGFEAGGHNGKEETTTLCLVPQVVDAVDIPVIAAGGICDGRSMLAAMALGAQGVQIGSRFVASEEASAHVNFKARVLEAREGDTQLTLKELTPVRLLNNSFAEEIRTMYREHASVEAMKEHLGRGRAKSGMFEGDLDRGELEIGQVSARIDAILPAKDIIQYILNEYRTLKGPALGGYFDF